MTKINNWATKRINNIILRYNKTIHKWQLIAPDKTILQEGKQKGWLDFCATINHHYLTDRQLIRLYAKVRNELKARNK
jgi:hypothetical protein